MVCSMLYFIFNHNNYNFLKCDWYMNCFIISLRQYVRCDWSI